MSTRVTSPTGALLGGITGQVIAYLWHGRPVLAGIAALVEGMLSTVLFLYVTSFFLTKSHNSADRVFTLVLFGLPLLWAAALFGSGILVLAKRTRITAHSCAHQEHA